jgi:nitroreductase
MRVVPTPTNAQHYSVYVFLKDAVYLYDAEENQLLKKATGDHRRIIGGQEYVYIAPINLLFVADTTRWGGGASDVSIGCMSQNVYLASAALGLSTVVRMSAIDVDAIRTLLGLAETDEMTIAQTVGYAPEPE